ncbi:hypothetical protein [Methylobacterium gnaphalii]|uniref:Uncharacterized protein n=1 Tax=Methylobacterium gnaphalii TaxID=1010610 RepID=A0A512JRF7_9HYPH|nr:hypothetical protein [Methylobacterium gnaphalii]GEP12548.1 hypothetical protein MGN01_43930 [Methylobacterium gnaphalii]GJD71727.1 hypothetical protein MMMDOFMJ_4691 [Methylobacterium gnaphalii]GLS48773.1 hypothetical protein GCM10007885_16180 [Methylobacterium gnaphalii]
MRVSGSVPLVPVLAIALLVLASSLGMPGGLVLAQTLPTAAENLTPVDLDTEHLFGFAEGSDLGVPGEVELEWETSGRLGKRLGKFLAVDTGLALKVPLTKDFRLAPGVTFNAYDVGVPGIPTRTTGGFNGGFLETRLRLLDRRAAPFGLTLSIFPSYGTVDGGSGGPARSFGTEVGLLADREIIPGELVAAVNVNFAFSSARLGLKDERVHGSGVEVSGALAYQVRPGLFAGGEARYARAYEGLVLDRRAGQAIYVGPTVYTTLSPHSWASFTWSFQVAGQAAGQPGPLDLVSFDRQQFRLRVGYSF